MRRWLATTAFVCATAAVAAAPGVSVAADVPALTTVFFPSWSALIDGPAQRAIANVATLVHQQPRLRVVLTGYASTIGSQEANSLLARLRAQVVLDELVQEGVPADRIAVSAVGATTFTLDPVESRRVEIALGEK